MSTVTTVDAVDDTVGCQLYLSDAALTANIVSSKVPPPPPHPHTPATVPAARWATRRSIGTNLLQSAAGRDNRAGSLEQPQLERAAGGFDFSVVGAEKGVERQITAEKKRKVGDRPRFSSASSLRVFRGSVTVRCRTSTSRARPGASLQGGAGLGRWGARRRAACERSRCRTSFCRAGTRTRCAQLRSRWIIPIAAVSLWTRCGTKEIMRRCPNRPASHLFGPTLPADGEPCAGPKRRCSNPPPPRTPPLRASAGRSRTRRAVCAEGIPMDNPYCSCKLTRVRSPGRLPLPHHSCLPAACCCYRCRCRRWCRRCCCRCRGCGRGRWQCGNRLFLRASITMMASP